MAKNKGLGTLAIIGIVAAVILVIIILWVIGAYNGLVQADVNVDNAWAQVETSYQRRADLIPNLVATVQEAVEFEQETQTKIAELRTQVASVKNEIQNAKTPDEMDSAGEKLNGIVENYRGLNINVENYPQLKATTNFLALQDELAGTENRISVERKRYNDAVGVINKKVRFFPTNIIASMFGFEKKEFFEAVEGAETSPEVGELFEE